MVVQSVLFSRKKFTLNKAALLLKLLGFKLIKLDITDNYYRFRQYDPKKGDRYITVPAKNYPGVEYIISVVPSTRLYSMRV